MNRKILYAAVFFLVAIVAGVALFPVAPKAEADFLMTELQIKNLSCGSCVANIQNALGKVDGVESTEVNLTAGRGLIVFNPAEIKASRIAEVVTLAGYPAKVLNELTAEQYKNIQREDARLAEHYVARIGNTLLGREDFEQFLQQQLAIAGLKDQPEARQQILGSVWSALLQRTLMLNDAARKQVVIQDGEVDLQIQQVRQQIPDFEQNIQSRFGSLEAFSKKIKEDMTINRHIEQNVLAGVDGSQQRQTTFGRWYQQLVEDTPVLYYDAALKQATGVSGGCGSGCCSKS